MIPNYADHSANERTFLAWVRTVTAIVGFGLAAARLGSNTVSPWQEPILLISGDSVIGITWIRMLLLRRRIVQQEPIDDGAISVDGLLLVLISALFLSPGVFAWHVF